MNEMEELEKGICYEKWVSSCLNIIRESHIQWNIIRRRGENENYTN